MGFNSFQNDTATLNRYTRDVAGDRVLQESIPVECDVQLEDKRIVSREGEEVTTTAAVYVTPNATLLSKTVAELTQSDWGFDYEGVERNVESFDRVREPARDVIDHYLLRLR